AEAELWPVMLRVACVRFWLSRLIAAESFAGQEVLIHDPAEFQRRLAQRQRVELPLPFAL
ncbi:MAG: homoserine kinase, partial [Pseudomonas sp. 34-62-33]